MASQPPSVSAELTPSKRFGMMGYTTWKRVHHAIGARRVMVSREREQGSAQAAEGPFWLGIDLGGTNIKSGVVDDQGHPLSSVCRPTEAEKGPAVGLINLAEAGRQAVAEAGLTLDQIAGVGLGSPGLMDIHAGLLIDPPNLPGWTNLPIRRLLEEKLGRPTAFQNDANAAAFGEFWVGAGREVESLVLFTLGTGVGCGIIDNGRLIEGRHSHGAECGHIIIQMEGGREWPPGYFGRLEAYASATALVKRAVEALDRDRNLTTSLRTLLAQDNLSSRTIFEAADAGDALAKRLVRETARYLAVGAVNLMHTIDPDMVLFAGGMIAAGPSFLEQIRADIREMAFPIPARATRIEYAALGVDAGFIGAAGWARFKFKP
ncbi:ROK family protein [Isosphaera pallida]|nr:ROK family protein [Isosphaera pallida]